MVPRTIKAVVVALVACCALATPAWARDMTGKAGLGAMATTAGMPLATLRYWGTRVAVEFLFGWVAIDRRLPAVTIDSRGVNGGAGPGLATADHVQQCQSSYDNIDPRRRPVSLRCTWRNELSVRRFAVGALYRIADAPRVSLALGVRPWLQWADRTETPEFMRTYQDKDTTLPIASSPDSLPTRWGVEVPLVAEFFLNDHASITGQLGLGVGSGSLPERSYDKATASISDDNPKTAANEAGWWIGLRGAWSGGVGLLYYF